VTEDRYVNPRLPTRAELDAALGRDDPGALQEMVIAVTSLSDDQTQATDLVRVLVNHRDEYVRGNAVLGIGYIARRFGSVPPDLSAAVRAAARDPSDHVSGHAMSAADDLSIFAGIDVNLQ
jgi:hypothetical protein